jgi:hypothetical protein
MCVARSLLLLLLLSSSLRIIILAIIRKSEHLLSRGKIAGWARFESASLPREDRDGWKINPDDCRGLSLFSLL